MALPGDSRLWYTALVVLVGVARCFELRLSRRNARRLLARGGVESGASHYPVMVAIHAGFLVACVAEVWLLRRPFVRPLAAPMFGLLSATFALRYWAIATLGERWATRVITLPGLPLIHAGPYRYLRHPNYLAVLLEFPALALVHSAWLTALVFSGANAWILGTRIRVEERALTPYSSPPSPTPPPSGTHEYSSPRTTGGSRP